jgi:hypothetical protein
MYIKLPMYRYLFFYMALRLNDFDGGKSITRAIGRDLPKSNHYVPCHINNRYINSYICMHYCTGSDCVRVHNFIGAVGFRLPYNY